MWIYGAVRLSLESTAFTGVKLRIMQPNLQQDVKFNYSAKAEVMQKYLTLSDRASGPQSTGVKDARILIWPESAFPFFLTREADAMAQIAGLLPKGTVLITGSVRAPDVPPGVRITRAYNSIYTIDHDGSVLSVYDKLHLVPFGEYLPFQDLMEKLGFVQLTKVQGGFIPGTRRRSMEIPDAPRALPLICYEAIFPGDVAAGIHQVANVGPRLTPVAGHQVLLVTGHHLLAIDPGRCPSLVLGHRATGDLGTLDGLALGLGGRPDRPALALGLAPGCRDDLRPLGGEPDGTGAPESGGRARDHGDLPGEPPRTGLARHGRVLSP
jgi:predicted amidohydrolase